MDTHKTLRANTYWHAVALSAVDNSLARLSKVADHLHITSSLCTSKALWYVPRIEHTSLHFSSQFEAEGKLGVPTLMPKNDTTHCRPVQHICSLQKQSEIIRYCRIGLHAGMLGSSGTTIQSGSDPMCAHLDA